ncbi:hypothetical protein DESC_370044 [Desulfosarcina cetonica]|nr:hypothetical protein DESC_370044 [Desulfosarcina cetonica]
MPMIYCEMRKGLFSSSPQVDLLACNRLIPNLTKMLPKSQIKIYIN